MFNKVMTSEYGKDIGVVASTLVGAGVGYGISDGDALFTADSAVIGASLGVIGRYSLPIGKNMKSLGGPNPNKTTMGSRFSRLDNSSSANMSVDDAGRNRATLKNLGLTVGLGTAGSAVLGGILPAPEDSSRIKESARWGYDGLAYGTAGFAAMTIASRRFGGNERVMPGVMAGFAGMAAGGAYGVFSGLEKLKEGDMKGFNDIGAYMTLGGGLAPLAYERFGKKSITNSIKNNRIQRQFGL
jgi:hypothetical protein